MSRSSKEPVRPTGSGGPTGSSDNGSDKRASAERSVAAKAEDLAVPEDVNTEVGYRKPPREHRWTKGRSGNPAGRKKGSKNMRTIIVRLMEEKLGRKIEDPSKLTRYEAMLLKGIQKALGGRRQGDGFHPASL